MRKSLLAILALAVAPVFGQQLPIRMMAFQQPGWIESPDSTVILVHINRPDGQTGPILNKPFIAEEIRRIQQNLYDGNHVDRTDTSKFYRDAQGRMRDESSGSIVIYDPVAEYTYDLNLRTTTYTRQSLKSSNAATTIAAVGCCSSMVDLSGSTLPISHMHANPKHALPNRVEPVNDLKTDSLGEQLINGLKCTGTRITITVPAGYFGNSRETKIVNERWYSDALGVLIKSSNVDPRFGITTYELKNIVQTNPDPTLFEIPAGYTLKDIGK